MSRLTRSQYRNAMIDNLKRDILYSNFSHPRMIPWAGLLTLLCFDMPYKDFLKKMDNPDMNHYIKWLERKATEYCQRIGSRPAPLQIRRTDVQISSHAVFDVVSGKVFLPPEEIDSCWCHDRFEFKNSAPKGWQGTWGQYNAMAKFLFSTAVCDKLQVQSPASMDLGLWALILFAVRKGFCFHAVLD